METNFRNVVARLEGMDREDRAERARGVVQVPEDGLWALHPDTARLLHILVQTVGAKRMLEVGVSHGYSTVWLAHAARTTGGRLTALENNPKSIEIATANLTEAGLLDMVDFIEGDARETLKTLQGQFDYILLDCWDRLYPEIIPIVVPLLRVGGLMTTDNVDLEDEGSQHVRSLLMANEEIETTNLPIGVGGLEVSTKRGAGR